MRATALLALVCVVAAAAGELTVTVPFDRSEVELTEEGLYTVVAVGNLPNIVKEGSPYLPVMPVRVALPTGCRATGIEVIDASYHDLYGCYDVLPANEPVPLSVEMDYVQAPPNPDIYNRSTYFPSSMAAFHSSSVWWGIPMAYMNVFPVRWNPASKTLQVLSEMTVRVTFEEDPSVRLVRRRARASEEKAMEIARRLVVNPLDVSPSGATLVSERDLAYGRYVVITADEYETQAQELADWKTAKGIPANVYTTTWVDNQYSCVDLQQDMRAFLTDCRDEGADYVLIYGDDDKLECRDVMLVGSSSYTEEAPGDLYYADINDTAPGVDLWDANCDQIYGEVPYPYEYPQPAGWDQVDYHPDLWVGRANVNSASEADLFVDKVLIYEQVQSFDYFETSPIELRIGYTTGILWNSPYIPGSADAESISTFVPNAQWEEEKLYESNGTNNSTLTREMIDAGPHHVFHASHGSQTYMYTSYGSNYTVDHIMAQTNISSGNLPALWQSISCLIGQLDGYECCADAWIASPEGGGFGCFNSRYGFGNFAGACKGPSERLCIRFYEDHWDNDIYNLGICHGTSMDFFVPPCSTYMDWCMKEYNLFGDPELPMWTEEAGDLDVTHPSSIAGNTWVHVTVDDGRAPVENARVCLQKGNWQTGEVYEIDYTDASGEVDILVEPATTGTIDIAVWARNFITYQGTIDVTSVGTGDMQSPIPRSMVYSISPNPAYQTAVLKFGLESAGNAWVEVFDLAGRRVATVHQGELQSGNHSLIWDLTDASGARVPAGVYHVRVSAPAFTDTRSVMVLR